VTYRRWRCGSTAAATREDGVARSTTSVAVVYAVTVETGLNREDIGKLILTACFVTDLGTVEGRWRMQQRITGERGPLAR
jgi:hypothetical protein